MGRDTPYWHDLDLHDGEVDDPYTATFLGWQNDFRAYGPPLLFKGFEKGNKKSVKESQSYY